MARRWRRGANCGVPELKGAALAARCSGSARNYLVAAAVFLPPPLLLRPDREEGMDGWMDGQRGGWGGGERGVELQACAATRRVLSHRSSVHPFSHSFIHTF